MLLLNVVVAVGYLSASKGQAPSPWAILLLAVIPLRIPIRGRPMIYRFMDYCGHYELLTLVGFGFAFGSYALFEMVNLKGDLGALFMGVILANSKKSEEMGHHLHPFKDLFLIGFYLSIGLTGLPTWKMFLIALSLLILLLIKPVLFFFLMILSRLRARTAFLSSLSLFNYSELGLIVIAMGVDKGWVEAQWLSMMAIALR